MGITVIHHAHEAPLVLPGLGMRGQTLVMQSGVVVFDVAQDGRGGWRRAPLLYAVLDLRSLHVPGRWLPDLHGSHGDHGPTVPTVGRITVVGDVENAPETGSVSVIGGSGASCSWPSASWAVERTRARQADHAIMLEADVAALGEPGSLRLSYSLFVTLAHPAVRLDAAPSFG